METNLQETLLTICGLLEKHNVQYMLIGGTAVALNGYYRHSINIEGGLTEKPGIDLWYKATARKKDLEDIKQLKKIREAE